MRPLFCLCLDVADIEAALNSGEEVDVNAATDQREPLLLVASGRGNYEVVRLLLDAEGIGIHREGGGGGRSLLHAAEQTGHNHIVRLFDETAHFNSLHWACALRDAPRLRAVLRRDAFGSVAAAEAEQTASSTRPISSEGETRQCERRRSS